MLRKLKTVPNRGILLGGFAIDGRHLESKFTRKHDCGEPLTSQAIKLRNHPGTRFQ